MKKKIFVCILAVMLVLSFGLTCWAASGVYTDTDGDGICDNISSDAAKPMDGTGNKAGDGICGANYSDKDGDGICDNIASGGLRSLDGTGNKNRTGQNGGCSGENCKRTCDNSGAGKQYGKNMK